PHIPRIFCQTCVIASARPDRHNHKPAPPFCLRAGDAGVQRIVVEPTRPTHTHQTETLSRSSFGHSSASESLGARQSPRGEREPPDPTFGPFGIAERLNWLILKKR